MARIDGSVAAKAYGAKLETGEYPLERAKKWEQKGKVPQWKWK